MLAQHPNLCTISPAPETDFLTLLKREEAIVFPNSSVHGREFNYVCTFEQEPDVAKPVSQQLPGSSFLVAPQAFALSCEPRGSLGSTCLLCSVGIFRHCTGTSGVCQLLAWRSSCCSASCILAIRHMLLYTQTETAPAKALFQAPWNYLDSSKPSEMMNPQQGSQPREDTRRTQPGQDASVLM